jgi:hypothetical protein
MEQRVSLETIYAHSEDIVSREIEGELLVVPITAGIGDMEDELFTFNPTGRAIWDKLDGRRTLAQAVTELADDWDAAPGEIETHAQGLLAELLRRRMIVAVQPE